MKRNPYTDDTTIKAVRKAYYAGWTFERMVDRYGVSENTIRRLRNRYGWPMRQVQPTGKRRRALVPVQPEPRRWRCHAEGCGRLNIEARCPCGVVPSWAKGEAA